MDPDQDLVRGLQAREIESLRAAYERHGGRVQSLCRRLLGGRAAAEDAAQDVFLKLYQRVRSFDGRARFATWLHRLTVNHCLSRLEHERLRFTHALPSSDALADASAPPVETLRRREERAELAHLLARLSGDHRAVIVLRELEGLSYQEIAETLAVPAGTVMSRLARARTELLRLAACRTREEPPPLPRPVPLPRNP